MQESTEVVAWKCNQKVIETGIITQFIFFIFFFFCFVLLLNLNIPLQYSSAAQICKFSLAQLVSAACHHTASVWKQHACILAYTPFFLTVSTNVFSFDLNCCCLRALRIHSLYSPLLPVPSSVSISLGIYLKQVFIRSICCNCKSVFQSPCSLQQAVTCTYSVLYQNIPDTLTQNDFHSVI